MSHSLHFLVAPDSFKGSLSAIGFCDVFQNLLNDHFPDSRATLLPMSDGGEGFVDSFVYAGAAERQSLWASNALGRKTKANFAWQADTRTAIIEMAQASGLPQIRPDDRNPMNTHTYGTGQLIQAALDLGAKKIILGLGGSATNDGGLGALNALGIPFYDSEGNEIGLGGQALNKLASIGDIPSHLLEIDWQLACDVTNPLLGEDGATAVFGPQKGVTEQTFPILESGLSNWAKQIEAKTGKQVSEIPGAGAAGGMAAGFIGLLSAQVTPGFDVLKETLQLDTLLKTHSFDYIFTGEGRMDEQTQFGKLPERIAALGNQYQVPTIGVCGSLGCSVAELPNFQAIFSIVNGIISEQEAMMNAPYLLKETLYSTLSLLKAE